MPRGSRSVPLTWVMSQTSAGLSDAISSLWIMAAFITGTHHCPDCGKAQSGSRAFEERREAGGHVDWCAFICPEGHEWARPGWQAVK